MQYGEVTANVTIITTAAMESVAMTHQRRLVDGGPKNRRPTATTVAKIAAAPLNLAEAASPANPAASKASRRASDAPALSANASDIVRKNVIGTSTVA